MFNFQSLENTCCMKTYFGTLKVIRKIHVFGKRIREKNTHTTVKLIATSDLLGIQNERTSMINRTKMIIEYKS